MVAVGFRTASLGLLTAACTTIVLGQRSFEGSHWRVIGIDRAPIRDDSGYHMDFLKSQWHASFGCNGMSGEYRVQSDKLMLGRSDAGKFNVGVIMMTERDSSDRPDDHFENDALAVLRRPMTIRFRDGHHVVLINASGAIDLERIR
jgi:heat shock protein HslJ